MKRFFLGDCFALHTNFALTLTEGDREREFVPIELFFADVPDVPQSDGTRTRAPDVEGARPAASQQTLTPPTNPSP